MSVCTAGVSRVVEGRRNRCTRQRDADRQGYSSFFLSPPLLLFLLLQALFLSLVLPSLSLPSPPLSLSLKPSVITVQSPDFYRCSDVATGSRGFRPSGWSRNRFVQGDLISADVDAVMRCSFSKIFIFRSVVLSSNDRWWLYRLIRNGLW